jgi:hypothetical protein
VVEATITVSWERDHCPSCSVTLPARPAPAVVFGQWICF